MYGRMYYAGENLGGKTIDTKLHACSKVRKGLSSCVLLFVMLLYRRPIVKGACLA